MLTDNIFGHPVCMKFGERAFSHAGTSE